MSTKRADGAGTVDVTFVLPAEVQADSVFLCGEFNDWSGDIKLEREPDGSWRATVPLLPGQTYCTGTCSTPNAGRTPGMPTVMSPIPMAVRTRSS